MQTLGRREDAAVAGTPLVAVSEVCKSFGPTRALDSCSLELHPGEVHAIMGENGSGKSTLVKLLSGVQRPDAGRIAIDGSDLQIRSPAVAQSARIATVFQEVLVLPQRSVLTNIWIGTDGFVSRRMTKSQQRRTANAILESLLGRTLDLDAPAERLSISDRQTCCIARALVRDPRVLILDEATSALDIATRNNLFRLVRELRERGVATLFISHRMDEVEEVADCITVMRAGRSVASLRRGEADGEALVRLMTGADRVASNVRTRADATRRIREQVVLRAKSIRLEQSTREIDLEIRAGEIVGLAGLDGHGQDVFLRALAGGPVSAGEVRRCQADDEVRIDNRQAATAAGIAYIPRDRRSEGIFPTKSILNNFELPTLHMDRHAGVLRHRSTRSRFEEYAKSLRIVAGDRRNAITTLSGGNQQKVVLARWLATSPKVLLLNDPTRGVDLGAKRDIYEVLDRLALDGTAIVMLSTEVDELIELMDRVIVFREGAVATELPRAHATRQRIVAAFFGKSVA